jgi:hypothetical protein
MSGILDIEGPLSTQRRRAAEAIRQSQSRLIASLCLCAVRQINTVSSGFDVINRIFRARLGKALET